MKKLRFLILFFATLSYSCYAFQQFDCCVIAHNAYIRHLSSGVFVDSLIKSDTIRLTDKQKINSLNSKFINPNNPLPQFNIDNSMIEHNAQTFHDYYQQTKRFSYFWNDSQRQLLYYSLNNDSIISKTLRRKLLYNAKSSNIPNPKEDEFVIHFLSNDTVRQSFNSLRRTRWQYYPYSDERGNEYYVPSVDSILVNLFEFKNYNVPYAEGEFLLHEISSDIVLNLQDSLDLLDLHDARFADDIQSLSKTFHIEDMRRWQARGGHLLLNENECTNNPWYRFVLTQKDVPNKIKIHFYSQFTDDNLQGIPYIKKNYQKNIAQVLNVQYICDYFLKNEDATLTIFFFNKMTFTNGLIELFKDMHDFKNKHSEAIYFNLNNGHGKNTRFLLLPSDKVLLIEHSFNDFERICL